MGLAQGWKRSSVAAATVLVGVAAWVVPASGSAPLHLAEGGGEVCMEGRTDATVGIAMLDHPTGDPIVVSAVSAPGDGVRIVDAFVVRYPHGASDPVRYGTDEWPVPAHWGEPEPALGASVAAGDAADLVVHVRRDARDGGTVGPVRVVYTQGARLWSETTGTEIALRAHC
ncbi:hypothetical protein [Curtobacterium sp. SORGH_AS_0776]|uniref:hypothetical protein n=1 Tax=Curtobacterium sp. SORGH_AS_0776 TaxID=3041798 RepID=UPI00286449E1|nr:hypothetical protein [Curtobacterium sp. SORGH_AS_0776]MDR6169392.1 hypothetical protein [Curtobacterium sp. SORGH_AS_0776]